MAMTNQEVLKFVSDYESLEKAKSMDSNTFKSSLSEFGFSQATDNEAETLKNLIDLTVEKGAPLSDEELDNASGGLTKTQIGLIVGACSSVGGILAGVGGKMLYDRYVDSKKDPKTELLKAAGNYNATAPAADHITVIGANGPWELPARKHRDALKGLKNPKGTHM